MKDCNYLIEFHLTKTNEIIKNYEKYVQSNILNGSLALNEDLKSDKALNFMEEQVHSTSSILIIRKVFY